MNLPALLDAIKARILDVDLGLPEGEVEPVIRRRYLPDDKLEAIATLHVDVSPGEADYDLADRSELEAQHVVEVGFRQLLPAGVDAASEDGNDWLDGRVAVVARVVAGLASNDHDDADDALGVSLNTISNDPLYDVGTLRQHGVFLSVVKLTYSSIQ